jgi:hypothetical protein
MIKKKCASPRAKLSLFDILELARYHQVGIDDTYTLRGTLIPGVKPNAISAIRYYEMAAKMGYNRGYYEIATIHEHGCGDYEGSHKKAVEYYKKLNVIDNAQFKQWLNNKIKMLEGPITDTHIDNLRELPADEVPVGGVGALTNERIDQIHQVTTRTEVPVIWGVNEDWNEDDHAIANLFALDDQLVRETQRIAAPTPMFGQVYSDSQNTHDTTLNAAIKNTINLLENSTKLEKNANVTLTEIDAFINDYLTGDKKSNARLTLSAIKNNSNPVSSVNKTEEEVLTLIWNRIHSPENANNQNNLKENLADYLAECVEHGRVCCATGRVNRVVDTLNAIDPHVELKSTSMINQELMNKAAVVRTKLYNNLSDDDKKKVDSIDSSDVSDRFTSTLKSEINKMIVDEYIEPKVITKETADKLTSQWIDAL